MNYWVRAHFCKVYIWEKIHDIATGRKAILKSWHTWNASHKAHWRSGLNLTAGTSFSAVLTKTVSEESDHWYFLLHILFLPFYHISFHFTITSLYYANCPKDLAPCLLFSTFSHLLGLPMEPTSLPMELSVSLRAHSQGSGLRASGCCSPAASKGPCQLLISPPFQGCWGWADSWHLLWLVLRFTPLIQPTDDVVPSQEIQLRKPPSFFLSTLCLFTVNRISSQLLLAASSNLVCQHQMGGWF